MTRLFMSGFLALGLAGCASSPPPQLAAPTPFQGSVIDIASSAGAPVKAYVLFDEVYPNGRTIYHGAVPASRHRDEAAWMWDISSMTLDALAQAGVQVVDDPAKADVKIVYELVSRTPNHLRPVGYAAPDRDTAVVNAIGDALTFGLVGSDMVAYVNADYRATLTTPKDTFQVSAPVRGGTPFRQSDWNTDWRREAFALSRDMYLPKFNAAVGEVMAQLEPKLEQAAIR